MSDNHKAARAVFCIIKKLRKEVRELANKLKNLKVTKVDFVDDGANKRADIKLYKRNSGNGNIIAPVSDTQDDAKKLSMFKRIVSDIGKAFGIKEGEGFPGGEGIKKGNSQTFGDKMTEVKRSKVADEMWSICYALQSSLQSILYDEDLDETSAKSMMEQSVKDFNEIITESIDDWSSGKLCGIRKSIDETELEVMKNYRNRLDSEIEAFEKRGELEDMLKIDKSKMTPEERAAYDEIIKKYAVDIEDEIIEKSGSVKPGENEEEMEDEAEKGCGKKQTAKSASAEGEDIYKGLHPAVAAELKELRKRADEADERELLGVAKKYEIIGKKPEELVPTLKSLKAAGGTAYADMISVLDSAVAMAEASGTFSEIGKSSRGIGNTSVAKSNSETKVETIAKGYMEKDPNLSYVDAIAKAWENNPDLMDSYEEEAGF